MKQCPDDDELLGYADVDRSPEGLERIEEHLKCCAACAEKVAEYRALIDDIRAPVEAARFDRAEHVASVMKRLDAPSLAPRGLRFWRWGGGVALAATLALVVAVQGRNPHGEQGAVQEARPGAAPEGEFAARGAASAPSLSRDIAVQLYALEPAPRVLASGSSIRRGAALTAGLRNLGKEDAYLLLFAVDAEHAVHWITPAYTEIGSDPAAATIPPSSNERLLPNATAFDDLAHGALRVVAVITREPTRVSNVETLAPAELGAEGLLKRFPRAEVRQFVLEVLP